MGSSAEASHSPMATPSPVVASRRMARRLLSGAGSATITAYRAQGKPATLMALHALDVQGRLLVAALPPLAGTFGEREQVEDVRVDIVLESADLAVRVTAASAHLLGELHWLNERQSAALLAGYSAACHCPITGEDPLRALADLASLPGGRLGVVLAERVIVHDAHGVSPHDIACLAVADGGMGQALLWSAADEASAQSEVAALGDASLEALCEGVRAGDIPGLLCSVRDASTMCASLAGRVLCVDVTPGAVTLMKLGLNDVETFQVWLPEEVCRAAQVVPHVRDMVAEALAGQLLRLS